jgi:hypothetical protein
MGAKDPEPSIVEQVSLDLPAGSRTPFHPATALSLQLPSPFCHPACPGLPWERTWISCFATLTRDHGCGSLSKENHMQLTEVTTLHRKSGEAEGSAVRHSCAPHLPAHNLHQIIHRNLLEIPTFPLSSRAVVTFLIFLVFGTPNQDVFQNSHKTVILSEAPRGSIA